MAAGPTPLPEAKILLDECLARLDDVANPMDELTLRRYATRLEKALADAPDELRGAMYAAIGQCWAYLLDVRRSLDAHLEAARLEPWRPDHQNNIASCLLELGHYPEALEVLRKARATAGVAPGLDSVLSLNEIRACLALGDRTAALRAFGGAVHRLDPKDSMSPLRLTVAAVALGNDEDATELFARYLTVATGYARGREEPAVDVIRAHLDVAMATLVTRTALRDAVVRVLDRWGESRLDSITQALDNPAPETRELAQAGFEEWASRLPPYDDDFTDRGTPIRWVAGAGWVEA